MEKILNIGEILLLIGKHTKIYMNVFQLNLWRRSMASWSSVHIETLEFNSLNDFATVFDYGLELEVWLLILFTLLLLLLLLWVPRRIPVFCFGNFNSLRVRNPAGSNSKDRTEEPIVSMFATQCSGMMVYAEDKLHILCCNINFLQE